MYLAEEIRKGIAEREFTFISSMSAGQQQASAPALNL